VLLNEKTFDEINIRRDETASSSFLLCNWAVRAAKSPVISEGFISYSFTDSKDMADLLDAVAVAMAKNGDACFEIVRDDGV
jgi:hypothetical protein